MGFHDQLQRSWAATNSLLCVGLDPDPARFPNALDTGHDAAFRFCREIIDATADVVCAFKPQIAYFASQREEPALEQLCTYILETYPDVTLILDAKRGDIGSTAEHYAREAFGRYGAHAVTVNPYLGGDSVVPYFAHGGGVIALCRTSNPGGDDLQALDVGGRPLYMRVAEMVAGEWAARGDCGLVVGATYPDELRRVRAAVGDLPILVPGIGAQGGDPHAAVEAGATADGRGLIVSASRSILYASSGDDFAEAARQAALDARLASLPAGW
ncbi:MAG: orotidine-5'-phosphate decarboxylase [Ilumatobacter sp.]|uniref:orotidine-5'-phosphate decarboxylase n=1 Tax=Ilumatobacter sp. TaxID=1967498 RepID=UPI00263A3D2D|nr:orotidine-5'-phosphate decarboxylase [Ilumatobacter sp.]MDJ0769321.1 orotidine-5'-phosphate decarboxylase [Ilumatobacter sp.]